ncbi:TIGR01777 family oxidoreductase [Bacillaceae bacterium]
MKLAISGGTGFIGSHLVRYYQARGDEVIVISRSAKKGIPGAKVISWERSLEHPEALEELDAFINLAGETIDQRWTASAKRRILESRVKATGKVAAIVERLQRKPRAVINGSGISIYGTSETETFDETSPPRRADFLSSVVEQWEKAADAICGTRLVKLRIGIVLGKDGGAFPKMMLPYRWGVGGRIGSGCQWLSWIHIEDMVRLIDYCIRQEDLHGPVNATAPHPVTNDEFGRVLAKTMRRPHWLPVPAFLCKAAFGELSLLLLQGQRVLPKVLLAHGFSFRYPTLERALSELLRRKRENKTN